MKSEEEVNQTLRDIYARVPIEWRTNAVRAKDMTPKMKMVVDKALEDADFPQDKKEQLQILKENGYFNKEQLTEDSRVIKKIDNFVNREIKKAVKEGRLPNKKKLAELQAQWKEQKKTS